MQKFSVRHPFMAGYAATLATGLIFWGIRGVVGANLLNLLGMLALVGLAFYWNKLNSYAKLAQNHEIRELVKQLNARREAEFYGTAKDRQTVQAIAKLAKSEK